MKKTMVIIDGNSLMYRTFYGIRPMTSKKGVPTNAVYGFANILLNILENYHPEYVGVAFDEKKPTFRHEEFGDYKAGRLKMPEDLQTQLSLVYEMLDCLNIPRISLEGFEADDLIGTIAKTYSKEGIDIKILTGDRDTYQLVDDHITVLFTKKGITDVDIIDEKEIENQYGEGITPKALIEVKALMGDKSDNIPGVKGIGEKTALKLIREYHDLETLYEHIDEQKGKLKENLEDEKENAFLSRHLSTIITDVPVELDLEMFEANEYKTKKAVTFFVELDIMSIAKRLGDIEQIEDENTIESSREVLEVVDKTSMDSVIDQARASGTVFMAWYISDRMYNERVLHALAIGIDKRIYFFQDNVDKDDFASFLKEIMEDEGIQKIGHNFKDFIVYCMKKRIKVKNAVFDTYIAAYLLDPSDSRYNIDDLSQKYLDVNMKSREDVVGKKKDQISFMAMDEDKKGLLVDNLEALYLLYPILKENIEEYGMTHLYRDIEMPLVEVLASFEYQGFKIDVEELKKLDKEFDRELEVITKEIYTLAGREFNINSPKQLGEVLFEELKLPVIKKTKTGYSTSADVLEKLKGDHPIVEKVLEYRTLAKLSSTYIKGFLDIINKENNKLYSSFHQTVTTTGRISSSDPNLQNIPVKMEIGRQIRKIFIPSSEDNVLVDADYSQIELRILAHISGDETLIDSFKKGEDIHRRTASEIFGVSLEEVTSLQRGQAKAINFGLIYGKQAYGLSQDLNVSRKEAQEYIDMYFGRYPKVEKYMKDIVVEAKGKGYVTSLYDRRRYIPEINSRNKMIANAGERLALNTPIQGSAADVIKIAMVRVYNEFNKRGLDSKLILQVHDELIVDAKKEELEEVKEIVKTQMENAVELSVPLTVDINVGKNWYESK